jgi:glucose/arabinose dehydrogenase
MKHLHILRLVACCIALAVSQGGAQEGNWRNDWAVADEHFAISIDAPGFHFPTAIAFIPNPGQGPKDPLYFVTELRGSIKVVTNDRSVYTFAEGFFHFRPKEELPFGFEGQSGLAGICLAPQHGYVFVTYVYRDPHDMVIRNNLIRFDAPPETFALQPTSHTAFTEVFFPYPTRVTHQIGACQVQDEMLYVSVGDGWSPLQSQQIDSLLGKVIRMTLDGKPVPDNPFYRDHDLNQAANYVWAYGFRNPFGLKILGERVFVVENGQDVDRFLEIQQGENYLWNGHDWSISTNAAAVFSPSVAPVQLDHHPAGSSLFPADYADTFFVAVASNFALPQAQRELRPKPGILMLKYGLQAKRMVSAPAYFLHYRGTAPQAVVGLSFGPDGLYFAPFFANAAGSSAILKVTYNAHHTYPYTLRQTASPATLMVEKGCFGCHSLNSIGGSAGPPLDRDPMVARIQDRLNSAAYLASLRELERSDDPTLRAFRDVRQEIVQLDGMDKVRRWMQYHIHAPRFDNPTSQMPNMELSARQALLITDYLLSEKAMEKPNGFSDVLRKLPKPRYRHVLFAFIVGVVLGGVVVWGRRRETHGR